MADIVEVWADTGEIIERDFTPEELEQREKDTIAYEIQIAEQEIINNEKIAKKQSAINKLTALGLTEEEVLILLGNSGV